jgi:SAM-dependent methyltransferase
MTDTSTRSSRPLITSGTASWERDGAAAEHETLTEFLETVAESETIRSVIERSVEWMLLHAGSRVLDVGCGSGVVFDAFASTIGPTGTITGLDHADAFLAAAADRAHEGGYAEQVTLVRGDAHELPFPDDSFDAAHTERVLMHLTDPDQALRELRRVVRPGGWVVCAEPDLTGMRIDLADAASAAKVVAGFCASIRNPAMGLELNRRMAAAGLVDRRIDALTYVERDYDPDTAAFFAGAAHTAVDNGWLTEQTAAATLAAMQHAGDEGFYTSYSSMFIVAGQAP